MKTHTILLPKLNHQGQPLLNADDTATVEAILTTGADGFFDLTDQATTNAVDWKGHASVLRQEVERLRKTPRGPKTTKIDQAIALKRRNPEWTARAVAKKLGCSESLLSRSTRYGKEAFAVELAAKEVRLKAAAKRAPNPLEEAIEREEEDRKKASSARRK